MKTILITQFALLLFVIPGMSWAQVVAISGYVNDSSNGKALENVSIFEKNSGIGTITNQKGFYQLILQKGETDLSITNSGFKSSVQHFDAISDTTIMVSLHPKVTIKDRQKKDDQVHANLKTEKKNDRKGFKLF